jgi:flavin-binding protein dodecin
MPERTYKIIELVGVSDKSIDEAIQNAISRASETLRGLDWFEMSQVRGRIANGRVEQFQVEVRVGFRVMNPSELDD